MKTIARYSNCFALWVKRLFIRSKPENKDSILGYINEKISPMSHEEGYKWIKEQK